MCDDPLTDADSSDVIVFEIPDKTAEEAPETLFDEPARMLELEFVAEFPFPTQKEYAPLAFQL